MSTMELPTLSQWVAASLINRKAKSRVRKQTAFPLTIAKLLLHIVGFCFLTGMGFYFNFGAGLGVAALSCFALSWVLGNPTPTTEIDNPRR